MARDDGEGDALVIGLARKARGEDTGGMKEGGGDKYGQLLDSAAEGILKAVDEGDRSALREELMDFVRACMKQESSEEVEE
jgi:hypothetical protein